MSYTLFFCSPQSESSFWLQCEWFWSRFDHGMLELLFTSHWKVPLPTGQQYCLTFRKCFYTFDMTAGYGVSYCGSFMWFAKCMNYTYKWLCFNCSRHLLLVRQAHVIVVTQPRLRGDLSKDRPGVKSVMKYSKQPQANSCVQPFGAITIMDRRHFIWKNDQCHFLHLLLTLTLRIKEMMDWITIELYIFPNNDNYSCNDYYHVVTGL